MKNFVNPYVELVLFNHEDILTTSVGTDGYGDINDIKKDYTNSDDIWQ